MTIERKNQQEIQRIKSIPFSNKLEKVALECPIPEKSKEEQCLEIFCNLFILFQSYQFRWPS
jgi:hypothetical protein